MQGDRLSPLLFVLCMIPSSFMLRSKAGYEWGGHEFKIKHLLLMDDQKRYGKSYEHTDSLAQPVHPFSTGKGKRSAGC